MSRSEVAWLHSDPGVREHIGPWLARASDPGRDDEVIAESKHRRLLRHPRPCGGAWLVKHFRLATGPHPSRERVKRALGRSPSAREWRALRSLHAAGLPVPRPLGYARLSHGDELIVEEMLEGATLRDRLRDGSCGHRASLLALAHAVRQMHEAGWVHGDLHPGNVFITDDGPVLLDLQRVRRAGPAGRMRDLGMLDYGLAQHGVSRSDRVRVRLAALGDAQPDTLAAGARADSEQRRRVRAVGQASRKAARQHWRARTRQCLRAGPRVRELRLEGWSGLRRIELDEDTLRSLLQAHISATEGDGQTAARKIERESTASPLCAPGSLVVRELGDYGRSAWLEPSLRHSSAGRCWLAANGLRVRGIAAAWPLALLVGRGPLRRGRSLLVEPASEPQQSAGLGAAAAPITPSPELLAHTLCDLLVRLHERGVCGADLSANGTRLDWRDGRLRPTLHGLEGIGFPRSLGSRLRDLELSRLTAVLAEASIPEPLREATRRRYLARLPLRPGLDGPER